MAWTQDDIDRLKAVMGTGVMSVTYDGPPKRVIVYKTDKEMENALARMEREVAKAAGTYQSYRLVATRKGFDS